MEIQLVIVRTEKDSSKEPNSLVIIENNRKTRIIKDKNKTHINDRLFISKYTIKIFKNKSKTKNNV